MTKLIEKAACFLDCEQFPMLVHGDGATCSGAAVIQSWATRGSKRHHKCYFK
jgi:hypothetical protein